MLFVCSTLKHQLNTDIPGENDICISDTDKYHQESAQFNIILVLLNIIFKHNLKKLLNSLEFFLFNVSGMKTIVKL